MGMIKLIKLTITGFDSMENSVSLAECIREEQYFHSNEEKNAYSKCSEYINTLEFKPFLAWNMEVYPKITVKEIYMR